MSYEGEACAANCSGCGRCTYGPRANAGCSDCGQDFYKGRNDVGNLCDACCDQRDAHTSALETALQFTRTAEALLIAAAAGQQMKLAAASNAADDGRALKRMATAILSTDLSKVREVV